MFDEMTKHIKEDTVKYLFNITIEEPVERKQVIDVDHLSSNTDEESSNKTVRKEETVGRNDDCPCGSGKNTKNVVVDNFGGPEMLKLQDYRNSIESMSSNLDEMRVSL